MDRSIHDENENKKIVDENIMNINESENENENGMNVNENENGMNVNVNVNENGMNENENENVNENENMNIEDHWIHDEYDSEEDNTPIPNLHPIFVDNILNIKHKLYDYAVLRPKLKTKEAQDKRILKIYIRFLQKLHKTCVQAQFGKIYMLGEFPEHIRSMILNLINWIQVFFKKNSVADTVPYEFHLKQSLIRFPFIQNNSFIRKE